MGLILSLETATKTCSVCLAIDGVEVFTITEDSGNYSHAEKLNGFIQSLFEKTGFSLSELDAVSISEGPGSYTGLRIGTSTAKGFCYALDIPLIAVNSLKALAAITLTECEIICPMFDARRMEVYSALFDRQLQMVEETTAVVIDAKSYQNFLAKDKVVFVGPGAEKCREILTHPNAQFDLETSVSAKGMIALAERKFQLKDFVDVAYFEPFYLKDFIAGAPKKLF
jgi:tRNA threonylcarbamoyladenosine biosynthesis protein TsaB